MEITNFLQLGIPERFKVGLDLPETTKLTSVDGFDTPSKIYVDGKAEGEFDSSYPFIYSCDYIRGLLDKELSMSHASLIRQELAEALEMDEATLSKKLADRFLSTTL